MDRGILATIYAGRYDATRYAGRADRRIPPFIRETFIRVVDHLPSTKDCAYTNFCDITVRVVRSVS